MKIRIGFVSNSSSSSFIVEHWKEKTKLTVKDVEELTQRAVDSYNLLMKTKLKKEKIMKIGIVSDKLIEEKFEYVKIDYDDDIGKIPKIVKESIKEQKGKIVIHTTDDNTIPYVMSEMIDALLYTERWHWG